MKKISNLVMKNNLTPPVIDMLKTNIAYYFLCPFAHGNVHEYVGQTATKLERRLRYHTYSGSIKEHLENQHNTKITLPLLKDNTTIIDKAENAKRLDIIEAINIIKLKPRLNKQIDNFNNILKLYKTNNNINYQTRRNTSTVDETYILPTPALRHSTSPSINTRINSLLVGIRGEAHLNSTSQ